jgi:hypothetical protein
MIRARDLAVGDVVLWECVGPFGCKHPAPSHTDGATAPVFHELTLYDVELSDGRMSSIVVTESGEQSVFIGMPGFIVQVYADTPARTGQPQS